MLIASDHAGRAMKDELKAVIVGLGFEVEDLGTSTDDSVDYPDFGIALAEKVSAGETETGVLVCGSGVGMSIVANKFPNVRAALVSTTETAKLSKEHNNANVLVIGGRMVGVTLASEMVKAWVEATFEGGRHQRRLDKITEVEARFSKVEQ
ncbi:MAG: ribose 5-phosphate isomerase B [Proteobacteria bacterium]|nr:ribose 5-phosphate isomerase B [Pseudomonadota bacterium]